MYSKFFGLKDSPFSIAPDPRFLYMSERHREGLAHLLYGITHHGGFILLTGEVGTGKTTVCRCFLEQVPPNTDIAFIVHPKVTGRELLASICDELQIPYVRGASIKILVDLINQHLLEAHANGRNTVLIIDEAQNLSIEVLEQLRLLTNLETSEKKLLQIVLLGQPELLDLLKRPELRQLSQRITARYHLQALGRDDVKAYVQYRLSVAGVKREIFTPDALAALYRLSQGIPRLINLICDRAMLGAYACHQDVIDKQLIKQAAREVLGPGESIWAKLKNWGWVARGGLIGLSAGLFMLAVIFAIRPGGDSRPNLAEDLSAKVVEQESAATQVDAVPPQAGAPAPVSEEAQPNTLVTQPNSVVTPQAAAQVTSSPFRRALLNPPEGTEDAAYRAVLRRWGIDYDYIGQVPVCDYAEMSGLRCMHSQGNWRSLLHLDRPAVLRLRNPSGKEFFVAVLEFEANDRVMISLGEQRMRVSLEELDEVWFGHYSILWKLPPLPTAVIRANGSPTERDWLSRQLDQIEAMQAILKVDGSASGVGAQRLVLSGEASSLDDRLRAFQQSVGLVPDGIAGSQTQIHMNSLLDPDVPRLRINPPGAQTGGAH